MGLFDRNKKKDVDVELLMKNAFNVNELNENVRPFMFDWFSKKKNKWDFARFFLDLVINKIYQGMQNVTWDTTDINYLATDICMFIEKNAPILLDSYWRNGYMCIIADPKKGVRLPKTNELRMDEKGYMVNSNAIVIYSDYYTTRRDTHFKILKPILHTIDSHANNSLFASDNLGALGIITGGSVPISPSAKSELQEKLRKNYGVGDDQFNFILSNTDLKYQSIDLKLKELDFTGNIKSNLEYICHFFNVPTDFVFGNSTYANQEQAILVFYQNAIMPLAEIMLKLARATYIYLDTELKPSSVITYRITNVPQLNSSLSKESEEKIKYLELLAKLQDTGVVDTEAEVLKVYEQAKKMIADV